MTKTTDILPVADGSTEKLRAGDTMFHAIRADYTDPDLLAGLVAA